MRVLETVLYGEDLIAARDFYVNLLGLEPIVFNPDRHLFLKCQDSVLIIFRSSKTLIPDADVPPHGTTGAGHIAFEATRNEMEEWRLRLEAANVAIIKEIDWQNGAKSIYFNDPAGNVLEFVTRDLWF